MSSVEVNKEDFTMSRLRSLTCLMTLLAFCAVSPLAAAGTPDTPPRKSPAAQTHETVGYTQIAVYYSRPSVRERTIWGALVPWDKIWRAGANEATRITFSRDVVVAGQPLAAGAYSFFVIPSEKGDWIAVFNGEAYQWGHFKYDASKDVLRLPIKTETVPFQEELSYGFRSTDAASTTLRLVWADRVLPMRIETTERSDAELLAMARETFRAARLSNRLDRSHVVEWLFFLMNKGIHAPELVEWATPAAEQPVFAMLRLKAKVLAHQGRYEEAVAAGEKAMEVGTRALTERSDRFLTQPFVDGFADLIEEWREQE